MGGLDPFPMRKSQKPRNQTTPYVRESLQPGEPLTCVAQLHWAHYLGPACVTLVWASLTSILAVVAMATETAVILQWASVQAVGWFIVGVLPAWFYVWLLARTTELAGTDRRIIAKTGIIRRTAIDLPYQRVESVSFHQSVIGRLLGYGTIIVRGMGGSAGTFKRIDKPLETRNALHMELSRCGHYSR